MNTTPWLSPAERVPNSRQADPLRPPVVVITLVAMATIVLLILIVSLPQNKCRPRQPGRR
jgi:hypothetical protein